MERIIVEDVLPGDEIADDFWTEKKEDDDAMMSPEKELLVDMLAAVTTDESEEDYASKDIVYTGQSSESPQESTSIPQESTPWETDKSKDTSTTVETSQKKESSTPDASTPEKSEVIVVHHLEYSQSFRIVWLLEELDMEYELKTYERNADKRAPQDYKDVSPLGTSPTITQGDFALSESNAIVEYILDRTDHDTAKQMRPQLGSPERTNYLLWFHLIPGSLQSMLSLDSVFRVMMSKLFFPLNLILGFVFGALQEKMILPRLRTIMHLAEVQLSTSEYLAGSTLTAADIVAIYSFDSAMFKYPEFVEQYLAVQQWLERIKSRPKLKSAQEKLGQDEIFLKDYS